MRNCVRVALQSLNLPVKVRILVPQPKNREDIVLSVFSLYSRIRNELRTPQGGVREQASGGRLRQARGESSRRKLCDFRRGLRFDKKGKLIQKLRTPQGGVRSRKKHNKKPAGYNGGLSLYYTNDYVIQRLYRINSVHGSDLLHYRMSKHCELSSWECLLIVRVDVRSFQNLNSALDYPLS